MKSLIATLIALATLAGAAQAAGTEPTAEWSKPNPFKCSKCQ